jgi:hypothetical protein
MALFGGARDMEVFKKLNKEVIKKVIDTEVLYYKFNIGDSKVNLYDESRKKTYYPPVLVHALLSKEDQEWSADDFGPNVTQNFIIAFLRDILVEIDLVPEVGDIVEHNQSFYEIDTVAQNQRFMGKDPDMWFGGDSHGYNISIICTSHLTQLSNLNIMPTKFGDSNNSQNDIILPRNV